MITSRGRAHTTRHSFCHVELPRTEERRADGEAQSHTVYLVRLESHLGKFPSADTWFELRYSRFQLLHQTLRQTHTTLRVPTLPRARPRWLGKHHPSYVFNMSLELRGYLRQLLAHWIRTYRGFDGFIELLHALHFGEALPLPPPAASDAGPLPQGSVRCGLPSSSLATSYAGAALSEPDSTELEVALCWREYEEHIERLLELRSGSAESTPFEEVSRTQQAQRAQPL